MIDRELLKKIVAKGEVDPKLMRRLLGSGKPEVVARNFSAHGTETGNELATELFPLLSKEHPVSFLMDAWAHERAMLEMNREIYLSVIPAAAPLAVQSISMTLALRSRLHELYAASLRDPVGSA